jgi:hypothetical protein
MRKLMLAASIAALIAVAMTTEAAQRGRRQAGTTGVINVPKDTPTTAQARAVNLAMERQEADRYRGLSVEADPDAQGEELAVQERIADQLSRLDYVPAHRVEHFRWIPEQLGLPILGWRGRIVAAAPDPDGVRITVRVTPIAGIGTADHTLEFYLYSNGRLVHVASEGATSRGVTTFN